MSCVGEGQVVSKKASNGDISMERLTVRTRTRTQRRSSSDKCWADKEEEGGGVKNMMKKRTIEYTAGVGQEKNELGLYHAFIS
jgi:hypothetical protein